MPQHDPRIDAYIARAQPFARPILERVRRWFHAGAPRCHEDIKWGSPAFVQEGMLGGMSAFKAHVSVGFWRGGELEDPLGLLRPVGNGAMTHLKVSSPGELPRRDDFLALVRQAVVLDAEGKPAVKRRARPAPPTPPDLAAALGGNPSAAATWEGFAPSHRREYVEWIEGAKREVTRERRLAQAIEWIAEGKQRNWKYMK